MLWIGKGGLEIRDGRERVSVGSRVYLVRNGGLGLQQRQEMEE